MNRVMDELPAYYRDIKEFQELTRVQSKQLDNLDGAIQQFEDDQFILTSSEPAIYRREKEFQILPDRTIETLDFRKRRLLVRMMQKAPFTFEYMVHQLDELVGKGRYAINLDVTKYYLEVLVTVESQSYYLESAKMLELIIPLNMSLDTGVLANPDHIILHAKAYDFPVLYPITNTFHTAEVKGGLAQIPIVLTEKAYAFEVLYPITNTFVTAPIAIENVQNNVLLTEEYRNNDILYKRAGTIYAGEGDI
ncbi:putative phage tail protein [Sporosarcina psychrophila]|uniref:DUF2313 domain-containing protein n=1 Tax=Sporosarcina psychrophila TaxID=1476 RepID=A0ABV2KCN2_SPOPS